MPGRFDCPVLFTDVLLIVPAYVLYKYLLLLKQENEYKLSDVFT